MKSHHSMQLLFYFPVVKSLPWSAFDFVSFISFILFMRLLDYFMSSDWPWSQCYPSSILRWLEIYLRCMKVKCYFFKYFLGKFRLAWFRTMWFNIALYGHMLALDLALCTTHINPILPIPPLSFTPFIHKEATCICMRSSVQQSFICFS